jgi:2-alkyl-3-oxoalkanoate reductase
MLHPLYSPPVGARSMKRVGNIPPLLMNWLIGKPLVESMVSSFRVSNTKAKEELGWSPAFPAVDDALPSVLADLDPADH